MYQNGKIKAEISLVIDFKQPLFCHPCIRGGLFFGANY
jgi:hypothetical protein